MTNYRKKTRRKNQKGGDWFTPSSWFSGSSDPSNQSWYNKLFGSSSASSTNTLSTNTLSTINNVNAFLGDAAKNVESAVNNVVGNATTNNPPVIDYTQEEPQGQSTGGRRRRNMKGGKESLGLTYYASPISGLKVVQPTTWQYYKNGTNQYSIKGGSKKRNRQSRKKRHL